jgi:hypothetical protein
MAGWETPPGYYAINGRVPNETMTSGAIGAEHFYKLEDVLFTQYFTDRGHAIHYAWWRTPETIGRPGSHGCLNTLLDDARFLWDWAPSAPQSWSTTRRSVRSRGDGDALRGLPVRVAVPHAYARHDHRRAN